MAKYGIIYTAFGTEEYIHNSLFPWAIFRNAKIPNREIVICAVNVKFAGFDGEDDGTNKILNTYLRTGSIDRLIDGPHNIPETVARSMALTYLISQGVDTIIQWDSDEVTSVAEIEKIFEFVDQNPWVCWFRLSYKNLVFDKNTYLADAFTPPRIHRVRHFDYIADSFTGDNDIGYKHVNHDTVTSQEMFPSTIVPWAVAAPKHYTWLNDHRSFLKQAYQWKRWNHCSFCWDDNQGGLIFNPNIPSPRILKEKH